MWRTVELVGSGFTLAAFVAAAIASLLKARLRKEEKLIRAARPRDRARLVENSLEFFRVDTERLTQQQRFEIAVEQIRARARRFAMTSAVISVLALMAASVTAFAIYRNYESPLKATGTGSDSALPTTPTVAASAFARNPGSHTCLYEKGSSRKDGFRTKGCGIRRHAAQRECNNTEQGYGDVYGFERRSESRRSASGAVVA